MGVTAWALPVGVLGGLCVAMFVFIWWWFPRHYRKGIVADMKEVDERRQREGVKMGDVEMVPPPKYEPREFVAPVTSY